MKKSMIAIIIFIIITMIVVPANGIELEENNEVNINFIQKNDDIYLITKISGSPTSADFIGFGFFRGLKAYANLSLSGIEIESMIISNGRLSSFHEIVHYLKAPCFIGFYHDAGLTGPDTIFGIAMGDIEWR